MRNSIMVGMVAGSLIGATVAVLAMPYVQPEMKKAVRKSKKAISNQIDKMM